MFLIASITNDRKLAVKVQGKIQHKLNTMHENELYIHPYNGN